MPPALSPPGRLATQINMYVGKNLKYVGDINTLRSVLAAGRAEAEEFGTANWAAQQVRSQAGTGQRRRSSAGPVPQPGRPAGRGF